MILYIKKLKLLAFRSYPNFVFKTNHVLFYKDREFAARFVICLGAIMLFCTYSVLFGRYHRIMPKHHAIRAKKIRHSSRMSDSIIISSTFCIHYSTITFSLQTAIYSRFRCHGYIVPYQFHLNLNYQTVLLVQIFL